MIINKKVDEVATGRLYLIFLLAPFAILVCILFIGFVQNDPVGYFSFGLLVSAVVCNLAIVVALFLRQKHRRLAGYVWVAISVICLVHPFITGLDLKGPHAAYAVEYAMLILSFPSGILSSVFHYFWGGQFHGVSYIFLTWLLFFVLGAAQWFLVLPKIVQYVQYRIKKIT